MSFAQITVHHEYSLDPWVRYVHGCGDRVRVAGRKCWAKRLRWGHGPITRDPVHKEYLDPYRSRAGRAGEMVHNNNGSEHIYLVVNDIPTDFLIVEGGRE